MKINKLPELLKNELKLLIFLWLYDMTYKTILRLLIIPLLFSAWLIWDFDLSKLSPLISIRKGSLVLLRMQASGVIFVIFSSTLLAVIISFRRKYENYDSLTIKEQQAFTKFFKLPSVYEKRGSIFL